MKIKNFIATSIGSVHPSTRHFSPGAAITRRENCVTGRFNNRVTVAASESISGEIDTNNSVGFINRRRVYIRKFLFFIVFIKLGENFLSQANSYLQSALKCNIFNNAFLISRDYSYLTCFHGKKSRLDTL